MRNKQRACERIGIKSTRHDLPSTSDPSDLIDLVGNLNKDEGVDGILVKVHS